MTGTSCLREAMDGAPLPHPLLSTEDVRKIDLALRGCTAELPSGFILRRLLESDQDGRNLSIDVLDAVSRTPARGRTGYPDEPLYRQFLSGLLFWYGRGAPPLVRTDPPAGSGSPPVPMEPEETLRGRDSAGPAIRRRLSEVLGSARDDAACAAAQALLSELGDDGPATMAACLCLRCTVGTVPEILPPPASELVAAFCAPHTAPSRAARVHSSLTVGARALSKHTHRSLGNWWGTFSGGESQKNAVAETMVRKILEKCVWINIFKLPHGTVALELRVEEGYGARWWLERPPGETPGENGEENETSWAFRGFVEPAMEDGHEKGWVHG